MASPRRVYGVPQNGHSTVVHERTLYVFGGRTAEGEVLNGTWEVAPNRRYRECEVRGQVPKRREYHTAHVRDGRMYVIHGHVEDADAGDRGVVPVLNLGTLEWRWEVAVGDVPPMVCHHASAMCGDTIYVLGGIPYTATREMGIVRGVAGADDAGGSAHVQFPMANPGGFYQLKIHEGGALVWTAVEVPSTPRLWGHSMSVWNTHLFVFGGFDLQRNREGNALHRWRCNERAWDPHNITPTVVAEEDYSATPSSGHISFKRGDVIVIAGGGEHVPVDLKGEWGRGWVEKRAGADAARTGSTAGAHPHARDIGWFPLRAVAANGPCERSLHNSVAASGGLLIWGGEKSNTAEAVHDGWFWDPAAAHYSKAAGGPLPQSTGAVGALLYDEDTGRERVLVPDLHRQRLYSFDPASQQWACQAVMGKGYAIAAPVPVGGGQSPRTVSPRRLPHGVGSPERVFVSSPRAHTHHVHLGGGVHTSVARNALVPGGIARQITDAMWDGRSRSQSPRGGGGGGGGPIDATAPPTQPRVGQPGVISPRRRPAERGGYLNERGGSVATAPTAPPRTAPTPTQAQAAPLQSINLSSTRSTDERLSLTTDTDPRYSARAPEFTGYAPVSDESAAALGTTVPLHGSTASAVAGSAALGTPAPSAGPGASSAAAPDVRSPGIYSRASSEGVPRYGSTGPELAPAVEPLTTDLGGSTFSEGNRNSTSNSQSARYSQMHRHTTNEGRVVGRGMRASDASREDAGNRGMLSKDTSSKSLSMRPPAPPSTPMLLETAGEEEHAFTRNGTGQSTASAASVPPSVSASAASAGNRSGPPGTTAGPFLQGSAATLVTQMEVPSQSHTSAEVPPSVPSSVASSSRGNNTCSRGSASQSNTTKDGAAMRLTSVDSVSTLGPRRAADGGPADHDSSAQQPPSQPDVQVDQFGRTRSVQFAEEAAVITAPVQEASGGGAASVVDSVSDLGEVQPPSMASSCSTGPRAVGALQSLQPNGVLEAQPAVAESVDSTPGASDDAPLREPLQSFRSEVSTLSNRKTSLEGSRRLPAAERPGGVGVGPAPTPPPLVAMLQTLTIERDVDSSVPSDAAASQSETNPPSEAPGRGGPSTGDRGNTITASRGHPSFPEGISDTASAASANAPPPPVLYVRESQMFTAAPYNPPYASTAATSEPPVPLHVSQSLIFTPATSQVVIPQHPPYASTVMPGGPGTQASTHMSDASAVQQLDRSHASAGSAAAHPPASSATEPPSEHTEHVPVSFTGAVPSRFGRVAGGPGAGCSEAPHTAADTDAGTEADADCSQVSTAALSQSQAGGLHLQVSRDLSSASTSGALGQQGGNASASASASASHTQQREASGGDMSRQTALVSEMTVSASHVDHSQSLLSEGAHTRYGHGRHLDASRLTLQYDQSAISALQVSMSGSEGFEDTVRGEGDDRPSAPSVITSAAAPTTQVVSVAASTQGAGLDRQSLPSHLLGSVTGGGPHGSAPASADSSVGRMDGSGDRDAVRAETGLSDMRPRAPYVSMASAPSDAAPPAPLAQLFSDPQPPSQAGGGTATAGTLSDVKSVPTTSAAGDTPVLSAAPPPPQPVDGHGGGTALRGMPGVTASEVTWRTTPLPPSAGKSLPRSATLSSVAAAAAGGGVFKTGVVRQPPGGACGVQASRHSCLVVPRVNGLGGAPPDSNAATVTASRNSSDNAPPPVSANPTATPVSAPMLSSMSKPLHGRFMGSPASSDGHGSPTPPQASNGALQTQPADSRAVHSQYTSSAMVSAVSAAGQQGATPAAAVAFFADGAGGGAVGVSQPSAALHCPPGASPACPPLCAQDAHGLRRKVPSSSHSHSIALDVVNPMRGGSPFRNRSHQPRPAPQTPQYTSVVKHAPPSTAASPRSAATPYRYA